MKQRVVAVLDVWDSWSLYPPHSLLACRAAFSGKDVKSTLDGEEMDLSMFGSKANDAGEQKGGGGGVDGEPMADIDGQPLADDVDGEPMGDLDGEPMAEDVD